MPKNIQTTAHLHSSHTPTKVHLVKTLVFPVVIYGCELGYKESWAPKNWCFWTVVLEKTLESPVDSKEIKPANAKGNQPRILIGRTDAETEAPVLWPPDAKSQLIGKDFDAGRDWRQKKRVAEDEMVGWHHQLSSVTFNCLLPHGLQHARLLCPPPSPGVCLNSCSLSRWCYPAISSSATLFFCLQSFPASGSFPVSRLFASGGQSIGASASASVLPVNIQGWFPLGLTGLISLLSKDSPVSSPAPQCKSINSQPSLWSNSHICMWLLGKP